MNDTRTIFFVGKPGCGKGTQAKLLSETTGWRVISAGDQFRALASEDTPLGQKVKSEVDAGLLTPHWLATYLYLKVFFSLPGDASAIFDGFNRKVPEAEIVIESLAWLARPFFIFDIRVSDEEVRRRLALRKEVEGRTDDSAVGMRLKEYYEHSEPVIDLFRKAGTLVEINGEQTPEKIAIDIRAALTSK